ncbi:MAG: type VI secretion system baseplate subunit TssK [Pseudomonadota bacterium]
MDFLRPIYWREGMLLRPQHFQLQDRFHEALVHYLFSLHQKYYWGIDSLEINRDALQNQTLSIDSCRMVSPDGAVITFPGNARIESRSFEGRLPTAGRPLDIFLGLPSLKTSESNLGGEDGSSSESSAHPRRFYLKSDDGPVSDLFASDSQSLIERLYFDLRLFFGEEKKEAGEFLPLKIGEVSRTEKGFALSPRYIPPATTLVADPILFGLVKKVRDRLTAKGRELQEQKRERGARTKEIGARDALHLLFALTLNRYIPLFHQITEDGLVHPRQAYALLRTLVGELSSFSEGVSFLGAAEAQGGAPLPEYRHEDLWNCFYPAAGLIERLLDELVARAGYAVKLTWDGELYSADLDEKVFDGDNKFYLVIDTPLPLSELLAMMKGTAKICSREGVPTLVKRALYGAAVQHLPAPPPELPQRTQACHFLLEKSSSAWDRVVKDKNIAISFEFKKMEHMEIELTVLFAEK